ncbi:hypothetical protein KCU62_g9825, partial [Aureobasidium sp. EXF-3399]
MGTQIAAGSKWPVVGQRDPNPGAHGREIKNKINALMECARGKAKTGKTKAYPQGKVNEIFRSILELVEEAPKGPGEAMHPEATTKDDLDAFDLI